MRMFLFQIIALIELDVQWGEIREKCVCITEPKFLLEISFASRRSQTNSCFSLDCLMYKHHNVNVALTFLTFLLSTYVF